MRSEMLNSPSSFRTSTMRGPVVTETVSRFAHDAASRLMMVLVLSEMLLTDVTLQDAHRADLAQIHESAEEVSALIKALGKQFGSSGTRVGGLEGLRALRPARPILPLEAAT